MAIKAGNMIIGGKEPSPKPPKKKTFNSFEDLKTSVEKKITEEPAPVEKYKIREEGELIIKLNTKSDYINDVLDLDRN